MSQADAMLAIAAGIVGLIAAGTTAYLGWLL
jgi:hypothetical protein